MHDTHAKRLQPKPALTMTAEPLRVVQPDSIPPSIMNATDGEVEAHVQFDVALSGTADKETLASIEQCLKAHARWVQCEAVPSAEGEHRWRISAPLRYLYNDHRSREAHGVTSDRPWPENTRVWGTMERVHLALSRTCLLGPDAGRGASL